MLDTNKNAIRTSNATQTAFAHQHGFTLVEVLVALGIVSITLIAGVQSMGSMTLNAQRQWSVFLSEQCADNALNSLKLSAQFPPVGEQTLSCIQGNTEFSVRLSVNTTPNASFRRVDAQVFESGLPQLRVSTVLGRF